ncbi:hypothetical protein I4U23_019584 [Adineta vaga]|nr:hypothetical protein I4U23_019584 [Adineta vaga]
MWKCNLFGCQLSSISIENFLHHRFYLQYKYLSYVLFDIYSIITYLFIQVFNSFILKSSIERYSFKLKKKLRQIMYTFFLLSLFFLPMFYADQQYRTELGNKEEMFLPRSVAASYLFDLPVRQNQDQLAHTALNSLKVLMSIDQNQLEKQQQRGKRIHWEDLAFHATDYNRKTKKHY